MSYTTSNALGVNFLETYAAVSATTPWIPDVPFKVGLRANGPSNTEFIFVVNAATALAVGDVVYMTTALVSTKLSTSNDARGNICGVAVSAIPASGYGWVQVKGNVAAVSVLALAAANVRLNTTATAGALDDDGTSTAMQVQGIYLTAARGGTDGTAAGVLNYPYVDVTL